jgi:hypothetical protein
MDDAGGVASSQVLVDTPGRSDRSAQGYWLGYPKAVENGQLCGGIRLVR